jgi:hypothetical protein
VAYTPVPTLRSFLKLYTSLGAKKLANFLDADEEEMVQQLMVMKQASRSVTHVTGGKGLLDGQTASTSDLNFVIDEVCHFFHTRLISFLTIFRTWSISRSPLLGGGTPGGSSRTLSARRSFTTI